MAQQTINIGASPNDGTGTPLRTAFQYTNSNFSELYTAVGPSGNNIVVPGNATITGDLTVDTSTLKVDSANDRVLIGTLTALGSAKLSIAGKTQADTSVAGDVIGNFNNTSATGYGFRIGGGSATGGYALSVNNNAGSEFHQISGTGVATWSNVGGVAGTAMTLNATGLGVGVASPSAKLHVLNASLSGTTAGSNVIATLRSNGSGYDSFLQFSDSVSYNAGVGMLAGNLYFYTSGAERARIDTSGNVGIGVTPSAGGSAYYKTLEIGKAGCGLFTATALLTASELTYLSGNGVLAYNSGPEWKYGNNGAAAIYGIEDGVHKWYNAATGTAGVVFTPTQAMTLDASGNLLVGKTARDLINAGVEILPSGQTTNIVASSVGGFTTLEVYSTTAAAYRFYVGMNGTISATNTTISGISDARLKENVQDIDVGLGAILALKPRKFDWKAGKGKDIKGDRGFIAQEFETVFPNLIDEWKENAPEGEAPYKSVRQDLIPVLVKAIQELAAEVNALKNA